MAREKKLVRMQTFRVEVENLDQIDRICRHKGTSRSKWYRMAVLNQLVQDLAEITEPVVSHETPGDLGYGPVTIGSGDGDPHVYEVPPLPVPDITMETHIYEVPVERVHHIECIKSIDHEGECL